LLSGDYHLLITDQNMPCLTGLELVARIRNAGITLPVIAHSGCVNLSEAPGCQALHLTAVLQKSIGFAELIRAVEKVLPLSADADLQYKDSVRLPAELAV
jgi:CheY-like chemotaxis protein